jgi:hypothetical protein
VRAATLALLFLVGCDDVYPSDADQCLRIQLFKDCMAALPAGPKSAHYNDWSEVVEACESAAYYQSIRPRRLIKDGCAP